MVGAQATGGGTRATTEEAGAEGRLHRAAATGTEVEIGTAALIGETAGTVVATARAEGTTRGTRRNGRAVEKSETEIATEIEIGIVETKEVGIETGETGSMTRAGATATAEGVEGVVTASLSAVGVGIRSLTEGTLATAVNLAIETGLMMAVGRESAAVVTSGGVTAANVGEKVGSGEVASTLTIATVGGTLGAAGVKVDRLATVMRTATTASLEVRVVVLVMEGRTAVTAEITGGAPASRTTDLGMPAGRLGVGLRKRRRR